MTKASDDHHTASDRGSGARGSRRVHRSVWFMLVAAGGCGSSSANPSAAGPAAPSGMIAATPPASASRAAAANVSMEGTATPASAGVPTPSVTPAGAAGDSAKPVPPQPAAVAAADLPCKISQALAANCQKCHGSEPLFGAPMPLVTAADLQRPSKTDPSQTVAQLAVKRLTDAASPMPPGSNITPDDRQLLVDFLMSGKAPIDAAGDKCLVTQTRSDDYLHRGVTPDEGETCYEFVNHGGQTQLGSAPAFSECAVSL